MPKASGLTGLNGKPSKAPAATPGVLLELDVARMLADPPPPVPWLAEPILVRGAVTMLAGREGRGKSWLALSFAVGIGSGATIAGLDCQPGRALYIDGENGATEAHRRLHTLRGARADRLTYAEAAGFHLERHASELEKLIAHHQPDLVVLDGFRTLWPGGDENDSAAVEPVIRRIVHLARRRNVAILLLHHSPKEGPEYRGSTAIGAAVELGFTLTAHDSDPDRRERRELRCWKSRPAPESEPTWLRLVAIAGRLTIDEAEPWQKERSARGRTPQRRTALEGDILRVLLHGPQRRADVLRELGVDTKHRTARSAVAALLADERIIELEDGRLKLPQRVSEGGDTPTDTQGCRVAPPFRGDTPTPDTLPLRDTPDTARDERP